MPANLGQIFAFAAVAVFVITTIGSAVTWSIDVAAETDDPYLTAKYPNQKDRSREIGNYLTEQCVPDAPVQPGKACSDSVALLKTNIRLEYDPQRVVVLTETFTSICPSRLTHVLHQLSSYLPQQKFRIERQNQGDTEGNNLTN